jgi:hypothetical protein
MNSEMTDQEIERLLGEHLGACLDGQLGRAAAAFRSEAHRAPRPWRRIGLWLSGAATMAAGFTLAWHMTHPAAVNQIVGPTPPQIAAAVDDAPPMMQVATWSKVKDDGYALVNDRPVRRMSRKVVEEVEWYDAQSNALIKCTQPQKQVFFIDMKTD